MKATQKYFPFVYLHKVALVIGVSPTESYKDSPLDISRINLNTAIYSWLE